MSTTNPASGAVAGNTTGDTKPASSRTKAALLPAGWPRPKGYANGVLAPRGRHLAVAGMVGWDTEGRFPDGLAAQVRQALQNVVAVLEAGGAKPEHIVRMTWYVISKREYLSQAKVIGQAYRELIGDFGVAMTAVEVSALIEDEAQVEIEVTAVVPE